MCSGRIHCREIHQISTGHPICSGGRQGLPCHQWGSGWERRNVIIQIVVDLHRFVWDGRKTNLPIAILGRWWSIHLILDLIILEVNYMAAREIEQVAINIIAKRNCFSILSILGWVFHLDSIF